MAKYGRGTHKTVESAMHRQKAGTLKSGRTGATVKNPRQAIAIGLSEAREKGEKVPPPRHGSSRKRGRKRAAQRTTSHRSGKKK